MTLVFASTNQHKIAEIKLLIPPQISLVGLSDIGLADEIPETADTIEGNAILKAQFIADRFGLPCFADDTGLEVHALSGAPGVLSARYAGPLKDPQANIDKLLYEMQNFQHRKAQFLTVIALYLQGKLHLFRGVVQGDILRERRGKQGFGYDPIFLPEGHDRTFAEMTMAEKAPLSHRGLAVKQLITFLKKQT